MATKKKTVKKAPLAPLAQRVKSDPALLQRALADPGLRATLPDKYLSSAQRTARQTAQTTKALGDISTPLSGKTLTNVADTLTNREYAPAFADIATQEGAVGRSRDKQQGYAKSYYADLNSLFGSTLAGQNAANAASAADAKARTDSSVSSVNVTDAQVRDRAAKDAAVRGADVGGGGLDALANATVEAKQRALAQGATQQATAQQFGDAQAALLRGIGAATQQRGGEQVGQIGARADTSLASLAADRAKLRADKVGKFTDTLLKLRTGESDKMLTEQGLQNASDKAYSDAKLKMADIKSRGQLAAAKQKFQADLTAAGWAHSDAAAATAREFQSTQNDLDRKSREGIAATRGTPKGDKPPFTPRQKAAARDSYDKAFTIASPFRGHATVDEVYRVLVTKYKQNPAFAQAAAEKAINGKISAETKKKLADRGLTFGPPAKTKPNPVSSPGYGGV